MRQSLRLGSISGIPVGINWGLLLIAAFYTFNLAVGVLPSAVPDASALGYWIFAAMNVVVFFGSVLAHELGHSVVAQRNGIRVKEITLWLLGGVAQLEKEADDPGVEFRIAVAGPAVSVALAVGFAGLAFALGPAYGGGLLTFSLGYLAVVNGALAIFNMIPAAPLDGGRVLASLLWWRSNDRHRSRATAAWVGEAFGTGLLIVGVIGFFMGAGTFVLAILGFFLRTAAGAERRRAEAFEVIQSAVVATAMSPIVAPIAPGVTAAGVQALSGGYERPVAFPLWGADGVIGLIPSSSIDAIPLAQRAFVDADALVVPWSQFMSASVHESLTAIVQRAHASGKPHVLVYDDQGAQVGYIGLDRDLSTLG